MSTCPVRSARSSGGVRYAKRSWEDAWTVADIRIAAPAGPLEVYLDLNNALDASYLDITRKPAPGRALFAGIVVRQSRKPADPVVPREASCGESPSPRESSAPSDGEAGMVPVVEFP